MVFDILIKSLQILFSEDSNPCKFSKILKSEFWLNTLNIDKKFNQYLINADNADFADFRGFDFA